MEKMKILYLTNVPSPYRIDYFNELGKLCDLTVVFERNTSAERDKSWLSFSAENFSYHIMNGIHFRVDSSVCFEVIKYLSRDYDHIVVTNFSDPTGIFAILYLKMKHIAYEIESDGGFPNNSVSFLKSSLKRFLFKGADLFFSTASVHDDYYLQYGASPDKIVRYPFSSIYENEIIGAVISDSDKKALRSRLNIPEDKVVISVGRFSYEKGYGKGYDLLVKIANKKRDVGFYIIGDNPTREFLDFKRDLNLANLHFVSFLNKAALKEYYQAADLMVLLTRGDVWGLVVNEALSNGLPVVTTDRCVAGLELIDSNNGYIVPADSTDEAEVYIDHFFSNLDLRRSSSENAIIKSHEYTLEKMASAHIDIWNHISSEVTLN